MTWPASTRRDELTRSTAEAGSPVRASLAPGPASAYAGTMSDYRGTGSSEATREAPEAQARAEGGPPFAECVLCRKPTEYPESYKGITLCPVCEWQEAERAACSG